MRQDMQLQLAITLTAIMTVNMVENRDSNVITAYLLVIKVWFSFCPGPLNSAGHFQLNLETVWFCRVIRLFSSISICEQGCKERDCIFITVPEGWEGGKGPFCICKFAVGNMSNGI